MVILQRHQGRHYLDLRKNRFDGDLGIVPLEFRRVRCCPLRVHWSPIRTYVPSNDSEHPPTPPPQKTQHRNQNKIQDTGTLKEADNARLASALAHEEQYGPPRYGQGGGYGAGQGGAGGGEDPRNQPLVKERQFY